MNQERLLTNFVDAAFELMKARLSGLSIEQALAVERAQRLGGDIVLVFAPGAGTVVGALHMEGSDADPVPLFKILVPLPEGTTN